VCVNIFHEGGNIMNTDQMKPKPMNKAYFPRKRKASFLEFIFVLSTKKNCSFLN
jgi:hypothetical protein